MHGYTAMKTITSSLMFVASLLLFAGPAAADEYSDTIAMFQKAGESASFFKNSYAYAVFPTVGKGGIGVGAAHGSGRAYVGGRHVGNVKLNQLSVGLQLGGQAFSEIIFFQDKRAFDEFASGSFEFDATAQAVAITASASASAGTTGNSASAAGGKNDASTRGEYRKGAVVFTIAKGGLMYQAALAGQKFSYKPAK